MRTLVSFDIDGTMAFGDPPGNVTAEDVRDVKTLGFIVGSASDRPIADQSEIWHDAGIEVEFVSLKHRLAQVKEQFTASRYVHVGDTMVDKRLAQQAGFDFVWSSTARPAGLFLLLAFSGRIAQSDR